MHLGLALPQYDYSVAGERPLRFDTIVEYARAGTRRRLRFGLAVRPLVPRPREVRRCARPRGVLRPDRHAGRLGALCPRRPARHAGVLRGAPARFDPGQGAGDARPGERRPCRRRARRGLVRARVRGDRHDDARARPAARPPRGGSRRGEGRAPRRDLHLRRHVSPRRPRERAPGARCSGRARVCSSVARATGCCGSSPTGPTAGTPAGRGRPTRTASASTCSTRPAIASAATPRPYGARSGSTRSSARIERDLERRFERLVAEAPPGVVGGDVDAFQNTRLVGTVDEVREQAATWEAARGRHADRGGRRGAVPRHEPRRRRDVGSRARRV